MNWSRFYLLLFYFFIISLVAADLKADSQQLVIEKRSWEKISIRGAKCGDGRPYHVYYRPGRSLSSTSSRRLAIGLMSGGACWNTRNCVGPTPLTWIHPLPFMVPSLGILSSKPEISPLADYPHLFLPYCTGDVFLGTHVATYIPFTKIHHVGKTNLQLTFDFLQKFHDINFSDVEEVIVHGSSAGALGGLASLPLFEQIFSGSRRKILIADSPGLHFGEKFWEKFSAELIYDYREALSQLGIYLDQKAKPIASQLPGLCQRFSSWRIGILQGSQDLVMSSLFGNISPMDHEKLVLGKDGLFQTIQQFNGNCSAWVPKTHFHTFLLNSTGLNSVIEGKSVKEFLNDFLEGKDQLSYQGNLSIKNDLRVR